MASIGSRVGSIVYVMLGVSPEVSASTNGYEESSLSSMIVEEQLRHFHRLLGSLGRG